MTRPVLTRRAVRNHATEQGRVDGVEVDATIQGVVKF